jgi:ribonuclease R
VAFGKDVVLAYLEVNPGADRRQIARDLRLKSADRRLLKAIHAELAPARAATPPLAADSEPAASPAPDIVAARVVGFDDETAEPVLAPAEWLRAGPPPRIRLRRLDAAALAPGSRALVRIDRRDGHEWRGRLLRAADEMPERVVGVVRATPQGRIVEPADRRLRQEFLLVPGAEPPPRAGDLVVARPLPVRRFERPRAALVEHLGDSGSPRAASAIALALHDIPVEFSAAALAEIRRCARASHEAPRADLRAIKLVTIDGADARDFDDAVHAVPDPDTQGWRITVAIADVAWYVRPGSALDHDAALRGNSVYFPDRVVPMLPERLSNDLCSLRPGEDRPVLAAELRIDAGGTLHAHRFVRATMRSAARLTYDQVQAWRDGDPSALPADLHEPARHLFAAYAALAAARARRGTRELDLPERAVTVGPEGRIAAIAPRAPHDSHRLIEEMMILANVAAAESLERSRQPCLYRIHERPSDERLDALGVSLAALGYRLAKGQGVRPALLRDVLAWAAGKPFQDMVSDLVLRSQALALYSPENPGHFGLALPRYAHFTSPIRRYADLVVHRALIAAHGLGDGGATPDHASLAATGERVSRAERRAQAAERAALERHVAQFLAARVGASFAARVSGLHRAGIFVALTETGAEGLVPMSSLPGRWRLHPAGHLLEGPGGRIGLADKVTVRLVEAAGISGALRFELDLAPAPGGQGARTRPGPRGRRGSKRRPA